MHIKDFYKKLENHDWYYQYSGDAKKLEAGEDNYISLVNIAMERAVISNDKSFNNLLSEYECYMFSGKPWGTEKKPKPCWEDYQ